MPGFWVMAALLAWAVHLRWQGGLAAAVVLGWTLLGGLDLLNGWLVEALGTGMWQQLALLGAFAFIGGLLDLPFYLYCTFVVEERFGFNKMTPRLWLKDTLKSTLLGVVTGLVPRFTGGAVGFWGYDVVRTIESLAESPPDEGHCCCGYWPGWRVEYSAWRYRPNPSIGQPKSRRA